MHFLLNYALLNTPMWYGKYVIILSALEGCSKSSFKASKLLKLFILIEPYLVIGDTVRGIQLKKKKKLSHLHPAARQFCRSTYTITDITIK
jgi:hypothetical protein